MFLAFLLALFSRLILVTVFVLFLLLRAVPVPLLLPEGKRDISNVQQQDLV